MDINKNRVRWRIRFCLWVRVTSLHWILCSFFSLLPTSSQQDFAHGISELLSESPFLDTVLVLSLRATSQKQFSPNYCHVIMCCLICMELLWLWLCSDLCYMPTTPEMKTLNEQTKHISRSKYQVVVDKRVRVVIYRLWHQLWSRNNRSIKSKLTESLCVRCCFSL